MKTTVRASIVGMKYYGFTTAEAAKQLRAGPALTREPYNSHDTNAIAVTVNTKTIGHIDRQSAAIIAPLLDSGAIYDVEIGEPAGQSIPLQISILQELPRAPVPNVCGTRTVGIYAVWAGSDRYVGQSKDIQNRIAQHWDDLHRGIHKNPRLRQLWRELGSGKFSAEVLEVAPGITRSLELARWLHSRECHWIDTFGGLRNVINADFPQPVLDEAAKRELQLERDAARSGLQAMDRKCQELERRRDKLYSALSELKPVVSRAERFWGIFNSARTEAEAEAARRNIVRLQGEVRNADDERAAVHGKISDLKRHLFIWD